MAFRIAFVACNLAVVLLALAAQAGTDDYQHLSLTELEKLAAQGDAVAQVELGLALEHGEGIAKDPALAIDWYCRAAGQGSADAQRNLGWIYANGRGVPRDDAVAAYWLRRAAASGDAYAGRFLRHLAEHTPPENTGCSSIARASWLKRRCRDEGCHEIVRLVESLAGRFGLEADLVLSVISAESNFDPQARSPKGACGLMQLVPVTAQRFGVQDLWNPEQNIRGGMAYLQWLLAYFEGDLELALAGYNAGEHKVRKFQGVPPYAETRAYIKRILRDYGKNHHRFDPRWLHQAQPYGETVVRTSITATSGLDG